MPFDPAAVRALFSALSEDLKGPSSLHGASVTILAALFENGVVKAEDFSSLHREGFLDTALALAKHLPVAEASRLPLALIDAGVDPWAATAPERMVEASLAPSLRPVLARILNAPTRPSDWDGLPVRLPSLPAGPLPLTAALASVRPQEGDLGVALDAGANPNRPVEPGRTVMAYAGRPEALRRLLAAGGRLSESGWHEHQASRKNQQKWSELVPLVATSLVQEGRSAYGPEWDPLIDRALKSLSKKDSTPELWQALSRHWERSPAPLTWRTAPFVGWALDAGFAHQALLGLRSRPPAASPLWKAWRESSVRPLGLDRNADWSLQDKPGVPNGVWPALLHWCRRAGAEHFRERWLAADPTAFWDGVLVVLDEWKTRSVWWPLHTVVLATLTCARPSEVSGLPVAALAERRTEWVDAFLENSANQDVLHSEPFECLLQAEASAAVEQRSEKGLSRVVRMLALALNSDLQKRLLETLAQAQRTNLRAELGEESAPLLTAVRSRLRTGRHTAFDAWVLGNELPDPRPGIRPRL